MNTNRWNEKVPIKMGNIKSADQNRKYISKLFLFKIYSINKIQSIHIKSFW